MKLLDFAPNQNPMPHQWHLCTPKTGGGYTVTGWSHTIEIGDVLDNILNCVMPKDQYDNHYLIVESLEKADHKGVFKNPADKVNTFYTAHCRVENDKEFLINLYQQNLESQPNNMTIETPTQSPL